MRFFRILSVFVVCLFPGAVCGQSFEKCEKILAEILPEFNRAFEENNPAILRSSRYQKKLTRLREAYTAYHSSHFSPGDSVARINNEAILMVLSGHQHRAVQHFTSLAGKNSPSLTDYHLALTQLLLGDFSEAAEKLVTLPEPNAPLNAVVALGNTREKQRLPEALLQLRPRSGQAAKWHYNKGILLRQAGEKQAAVESFTNALAEKAIPRYRIARGDIFLELGDFGKALEDYERAGKKHPAALIRRGYALSQMNQHTTARQVLRTYLKTRHRTYRNEAFLGIADTFYQEQEYADARKYYEQAGSTRQSAVFSQYGMGNVALAEHRYGAARSIFDGILARDSTRLSAYLGRAIARYGLGDFEGALEDFEKSDPVIDVSKEIMADVLVCRGYAHYYSGNKEQAQKDFEQAVSLDPGRYEALAGLGSLEIGKRRYPDAGKFLSAALDHEKGYDRLWSNYGNLLMHFNMHDKAYAVFNTAAGLNPLNLHAQNGRGITMLEKDMLEESKSLFDSLVRKNPRQPVLMNNRGIVHAYLGNRFSQERDPQRADHHYRLAEKDFNLAMTTAPAKTFYHVNKGNVFRYWQQYDDARLSYQTYQDKSALNNTAVLLAGLERMKDAEYYMNVALQLDSTHRVFHYNMDILAKGKAKEMARFVASAGNNGPYSEISIKYSLDGYVTIYLYDYEYQDMHFRGRHRLPPMTAGFSDSYLIPEYDFRLLPYTGERKDDAIVKKKKGKTPKARLKGRSRSGTKCPVLF